jgi:hypothetical protein
VAEGDFVTPLTEAIAAHRHFDRTTDQIPA